MSEYAIQLVSIVKLLVLVVFASLYAYAGIFGKWKRRFIAPIVLVASMVGISAWLGEICYWYIAYAPLLIGALSMGYGGDDLKTKLIKRSRYGAACAVASLPVFIATGSWALLVAHTLVCVAVSVAAGVWNQTSSARSEETLIGAAIVLIPLMVI
jgi:hypothetical protein